MVQVTLHGGRKVIKESDAKYKTINEFNQTLKCREIST